MIPAAPPAGEHDGEVITFYSYKGGVGRSMALANVAALLAQEGKQVLAVDCDFEAPGLHRYFPNAIGARRGREPEGMIDFFAALKTELTGPAPVLSNAVKSLPTNAGDQAIRATAAIDRLLAEPRFGYQARVANPNGNADCQVTIWPAGRFDGTYPETVRSFDWQNFYREHPYIFPALAAKWSRRFDYILIDSRTGLTDVGGVCTVLLPEKLVLVFTPNNQSLHGALEVGRQAVEQRGKSQDLRPLVLLPLISRVENAEYELRERWIEKARLQFEDCFRRAYGLERCDLFSYFKQVRISHSSYYAYDEIIAAERQAAIEQGSLTAAYSSFTRILCAGSPEEALETAPPAPSTLGLAAPQAPRRWKNPIALAVGGALIAVLGAWLLRGGGRADSTANDPLPETARVLSAVASAKDPLEASLLLASLRLEGAPRAAVFRAEQRGRELTGADLPIAEFRGHKAAITAAAFCGTTKVATVAADGDVRLWSADGMGDPVAVAFGGPSGAAPTPAIAALACSLDGAQVAIGFQDGTVRLWRPGAPPRTFTVHAAGIKSLRFDPAAKFLLSIDNAGIARLSTAGGATIAVLGDGSPDGQILAGIFGAGATPLLATAAGLVFGSAESGPKQRRPEERRPKAFPEQAGRALAAVAPDGGAMAVALGDALSVFTASSGGTPTVSRHLGMTMGGFQLGAGAVGLNQGADIRVLDLEKLSDLALLKPEAGGAAADLYRVSARWVWTARRGESAVRSLKVHPPSSSTTLPGPTSGSVTVLESGPAAGDARSGGAQLVLTGYSDGSARLWSFPRPALPKTAAWPDIMKRLSSIAACLPATFRQEHLGEYPEAAAAAERACQARLRRTGIVKPDLPPAPSPQGVPGVYLKFSSRAGADRAEALGRDLASVAFDVRGIELEPAMRTDTVDVLYANSEDRVAAYNVGTATYRFLAQRGTRVKFRVKVDRQIAPGTTEVRLPLALFPKVD